jgi:hypothetical protein
LHKIHKNIQSAAMAAPTDNMPFVVCARCGEVMPLIRSVPRAGVFPEMQVFVCGSCGEVETVGIPQQQKAG